MKTTNIRKKGFSLMEVMIAMTIGTIGLSSATSVLLQVSKGVTNVNTNVFEGSKTRGFVDSFYQESRSISDVHSTVPNEFEFTFVNMRGETHRYSYIWDAEAKVLTKRNIIDDSEKPIRIFLKNAEFKYFDKYGDNVETANVSNINVNAVQMLLTQIIDEREFDVESPIIMFRNKGAI